MSPRYRVTLTKEERKELEAMTHRGKTHSRRFIHARALLLCDAGVDGPAWNVADVATALGVTSRALNTSKTILGRAGSSPGACRPAGHL
jgi:hypothetical protein